MGKVSTVIVVENWGYNELYPILQDAFRVLYVSYTNICFLRKNNPYKKPENAKKWFLEDAITDELIENEFDFAKNFDYSIIPQYKNIKAKTRIDIAVNFRLSFGKYDRIEIECKQLKTDNLDYIIKGGINKFKSNKYAKYFPIAGMLLYNVENEITENIDLLNNSIVKKIAQDEILRPFPIIENYSYTYKSMHKRKNNSDLDLYSCVFDFQKLIEQK